MTDDVNEFTTIEKDKLAALQADNKRLKDIDLQWLAQRNDALARVEDLQAENKRLRSFRAGHGMASEADGPEEIALLVIGLHGRAEAAEQDAERLAELLELALNMCQMDAGLERDITAALAEHDALKGGPHG
jgi:hypothetical protein